MPTTPLRKDAARNWERIVRVARELIDDGSPVQLNDVARRAGLGVGTVYRHFPTAEALVEAVAAPGLEELVAAAERAAADPDPWRAFDVFLRRVVEVQVTDAAVPGVASSPTDALPRTTELKLSMWAVGGSVLDRVRAAGLVRPDLTADDLTPLVCGVAHAVGLAGGTREQRVATAHRYLDLLLGGLRAAPPAA
ncbi:MULTISPECIES: TetR/AcrR family transcriptional regulator [Actinosynnema]|uniref:TetR/AcrR family transcriptional regulator n=1 Tax=Actinosynnema TaxID=40566 RepID=UPI0020A5B9F7|nr:TetR/AcrR family transcriptional regulator [Actinosynnema pretiosum]MCP2099185.1 transcriptional regulator, TetR family [Actinosynnema pretiosum]